MTTLLALGSNACVRLASTRGDGPAASFDAQPPTVDALVGERTNRSYAVTKIEALFLVFVACSGVFAFAYILGTLFSIVQSLHKNKQAHYNQLSEVRHWAKIRNFKPALTQRLLTYGKLLAAGSPVSIDCSRTAAASSQVL